MTGNLSGKEAKALIEDENLAEEKLLEDLESGDIPSYIREARLTELKQQAREYNEMKDKKHGIYMEIVEEKEFLDITTKEEKCVIHFFHPDFPRCSIMDRHLEVIAEKYFECKFAKINVNAAKFFVDKLKIRILPAVICFMNGKVVDRIIGFEELEGADSFKTVELERRLDKYNLITVKETGDNDLMTGSILGRMKSGPGNRTPDSDSDNDW